MNGKIAEISSERRLGPKRARQLFPEWGIRPREIPAERKIVQDRERRSAYVFQAGARLSAGVVARLG